ncbi:Vitrin [Madurella mycetomatis]|uniref:Vitrin n=1 Tax=Madurella mycetomatis TaxID=100816 RepID=A0A175WJL6_9PEZI|nr:Vitrin [Madurella mycetomatis]
MVEADTRARTQAHDAERQDATDSDVTIVTPDHPDAPISEATQVEDLEEDTSPPTPRFIQDESSWKRFKWVPYPVRRLIKAAVIWSKGPSNPRRFAIKPLFPRVQHAPIVLLDRYLPRKFHRAVVVFVFFGLWILTFALVMRHGLFASEIAEWGRPTSIGCGSTYWASGNGCGLDGIDCRPFEDAGFAFRCPANCASYQVLNYHAVGDQEVIFRPLVVGGPPPSGDGPPIYRGDSFICGSAVHAGVISNTDGGCGVVRLVGMQRNFNSTSSNGITSVGFDSYFPLTFTFEPGISCDARDMRWSLLAVSVVFTAVFSLFVTSPALFFFPIFSVLFWTVGLATDTPTYVDVHSLFTRELGHFLPAMFVAWVMYDKMGIRRTFKGLTAQAEKTVLWLGAAWVGALTNYTLDFIPIQRLTGRDLERQPGARAALAIIVIILAAITAVQVWFFRQEARLIRYLKLYALFGLGLIICAVIPDLNLRIHHYILALLLLPGTSLQTRPSLLYQGLLIGLFVNGIARWGFDPILQTDLSLRGDAPMETPLPSILEPVIALSEPNPTITFSWDPPPVASFDGISVLVNDVERFREYFDDGASQTSNLTWVRDADLQANEYFRFAWMQGSTRGDYTRAGRWDARGQWHEMAPGPSRMAKRAEADDEKKL